MSHTRGDDSGQPAPRPEPWSPSWPLRLLSRVVVIVAGLLVFVLLGALPGLPVPIVGSFCTHGSVGPSTGGVSCTPRDSFSPTVWLPELGDLVGGGILVIIGGTLVALGCTHRSPVDRISRALDSADWPPTKSDAEPTSDAGQPSAMRSVSASGDDIALRRVLADGERIDHVIDCRSRRRLVLTDRRVIMADKDGSVFWSAPYDQIGAMKIIGTDLSLTIAGEHQRVSPADAGFSSNQSQDIIRLLAAHT